MAGLLWVTSTDDIIFSIAGSLQLYWFFFTGEWREILIGCHISTAEVKEIAVLIGSTQSSMPIYHWTAFLHQDDERRERIMKRSPQCILYSISVPKDRRHVDRFLF